MLGEEIEKIPLRHQRDVFAVRRQMRQIEHPQPLIADLHGKPLDLLMRQLEEFIEQPELVHEFERGRMNGVAAEIAEEIGVLLQHDDIHPGARQEKAEHHSGRSAPGDAAFGGDRGVRHHGPLLRRRRRHRVSAPRPAVAPSAPAPRRASFAGSSRRWCTETPVASRDKRSGTPFVPSAPLRGSRTG